MSTPATTLSCTTCVLPACPCICLPILRQACFSLPVYILARSLTLLHPSVWQRTSMSPSLSILRVHAACGVATTHPCQHVSPLCAVRLIQPHLQRATYVLIVPFWFCTLWSKFFSRNDQPVSIQRHHTISAEIPLPILAIFCLIVQYPGHHFQPLLCLPGRAGVVMTDWVVVAKLVHQRVEADFCSLLQSRLSGTLELAQLSSDGLQQQ